MKKFTIRYRLKDEATYRKTTLELPDMEFAVKAGYDCARGMHGVPVVELLVTQEDWVDLPK